jgi:hypothetical protein
MSYRVNSTELFIDSVKDNNHYLFVGNHVSTNTVSEPYDNPQDTLLKAHYGMIFGKKITENDVCAMIRRIDWQSGIVYDIYDHTDPSLYESDFYVIVREGTQYDVFKCLENGGGNPSIVAPSRSEVSVDNDDFYYPNDGYRWKYMYSISDAQAEKFATPQYFPLIQDQAVKLKAIDGAIDVINVVTPGSGYANYFTGTFGVGDIRLNGDPKIYGISTEGVKTSNGFYDSCWLYIASGAGAGQYRQIESYSSNSTYNFVELVEAFDPADDPENGSVFEIYPSVDIVGDGYETIAAKARAIIDPVGNTVSRVEMLNKGKGYNSATGKVMAASSVGVTANSGVVPIYSPKGGHGFDVATELGARFVVTSVTLNGSEANTVITENDYSQIGIIRNPEFRKITLNITGQNRDFDTNEDVFSIDTVLLDGTANTVVNANTELTTTITLNNVVGHNILSSGDTIVLNSGTSYQIANVVSVSNTSVVMDKAAIFNTASTPATISKATIKAYGLVDGFATGLVDLTKSTGEFQTGDIVIGSTTGTRAEVSTVRITGALKSYNTFLGCHTYIGDVVSGQFDPDEQVFQVANAVARATFNSQEPDGLTGKTRFYVTNQYGLFNTSADEISLTSKINGLTSGAVADLTDKYLPDLVFGSGDIIYIENGEQITRSNENSETFKIVFGF